MGTLLILVVRVACGESGESGAAAWVQRYSYEGASSSDQAKKVVTDANGDVIVGGVSDNGLTGLDMVFIKYSGAGLPLWTNRYNGPGNTSDRISAIAVDGSDHLVVAGYSIGSGGIRQYVTIRYSGAGVPLWTNRYNGPGNTDAQATAMALDGSGNVFVTGYSDGGAGSFDYATIKYSDTGVPLWTNRYNGPESGYDQANAVAVDGNGNVFVTGYSDGGAGSFDFATIKYSGAGVALWTNRYNGPGNGYDQANAVAVDNGGNVFVTGFSFVDGSDYDYVTIKYSGVGMPLWTNRYNGSGNDYDQANVVAVDGGGNVFVTGFSFATGGNYDYATIKYSGAGMPLWTNSYDGPGNSDDYASALVVDGTGNVFVTGFSGGIGSSFDYATIKYSGAGMPLWTNRYDGPRSNTDQGNAVAVDGNGNAFVTGSSVGIGNEYDYATIAYSGEGVPLWTNRYNGPGNGADGAIAVAVDGSGNVLVTGSSFSGDSNYDYATVKYTAAGVPLWTNRYSGPGINDDHAIAVAVDSSSAVFVTGYSYGERNNYDYATIAYSSAGLPLWTNRFFASGGGQAFATAIVVDGNGNVVVTGYSGGAGGDYNYATIKYSGAGMPLWTNYYTGVGTSDDRATAVAADGTGSVFVTGSSTASAGSSYGRVTIAYSSEGVSLWTNRYEDVSATAAAVAVDGSGNVYVTGSGYATIAYSGAGVPLWTNHYDGGSATAVAVNGSGAVFVTGSSGSMGTGFDYATIAYSGAGLPLWTNRYSGLGINDDRAVAVAVDGSGAVFVTGYSSGSGGNYDYATIKYSGAGVPLWTNRYNGPGNGNDQPQAKTSLAIGRDGAAYVTGWSDGSLTGAAAYDYLTIKYVSLPVIGIQPLTANPSDVGLTLSGAPGSSWSIERALGVVGPWTNLGSLLINPGGVGLFQDANPPGQGAFYRAAQP